MAGNFQDFEISAQKISVWRFFDEKIRFHRFDLQREPEVAKKIAIGNHRCRERMTANGTAELAFNFGNILDVINMSVCQEQEFEIDPAAAGRTHPFACALGRVEENQALWRLK